MLKMLPSMIRSLPCP